MFKYYGSKHKLAGRYPAPAHGVIIEPFGGSAAYSVFHRKRAKRVVILEKDERVCELWHRLLKMDAAEIERLPDPVEGSRSDDVLVAFAAARTTADIPERFIVSSRMVGRFRPMVQRIAGVVDECRHFEVKRGDYREAPEIAATWFVDPPYAYAGGRWDRRGGGRYRHHNRNIDYRVLGAWCGGRAGQVIVCEQDGANWLPFDTKISAINAASGAYAEVFWHRGPEGLFD